MKNSWATLCLIIVSSATLASAPVQAQKPAPESERARLDKDIPHLLTELNIPSVSIARIEDGKLVFAVAYGTQSPGVPATPSTLYNIASMTKPITAEVVLRLVSTGQISLDEPMYKYWTDPDIATDERRKLLTPRLALSHQTGFPNWRRQTGGVLTFKHAPGETFGYSGEGFEYVAHFTANKTGTSFEQLAQTLIFTPTGMSDTAYTRRPWFKGRIALPTDAQGKALEPVIADKLVASDLIYTTPSDYAKFVIGVMNRVGVTPEIFAQRSHIQVSEKAHDCAGPKAATCPDDVGFGLGWEVSQFGDDTFLMHTGMDDGVFTLGYINPSTHSGTILFTNSSNGPKIVIPILERIGKDTVFLKYLRAQADQ